jgi:signal transduction histidine kinase/CheY-like chemotaxis protein/HPt (histidine-containing phosphotransfer) domain-containing protein
MKFNNPTTNVLLGFFISVTGISALMILTAVTANKAVDNNRWLSHTNVVISKLDGIIAAISRTESYQRAFLITNDVRYFVARDEAMSRAHTLLIDVIELTEDNPHQIARAPELRHAILEKFESINLQQAMRPTATSDIAREEIERDFNSTAKILSIVDAMRHEENDLLLARTTAVQVDATRLPTIFSFAFAAILVILSYLFLRIRIAIKDQRLAERTAQEARVIAEAATRSRSAFLANTSHEVRTPLNAILGLTRIALEGDLSPDHRRLLGNIDRSSKALLTILNDILDFSKIEAGRLAIEYADFDLEVIFLTAAELFGPSAESKHLNFHIEFRSNLPTTWVGDAVRIGQILNNLVANAIKFTATGEVVMIADIRRDEREMVWLNLSVSDTGMGLSSAAQEKLFEPFTQADQAISRKYGGTGLGLAIARDLAEAMGGTLSVQSAEGQGSIFRLLLPLVAGDTHSVRCPLLTKVIVLSTDKTFVRIVLEALASSAMLAHSVSNIDAVASELMFPESVSDAPSIVIVDDRYPESGNYEPVQRLKELRAKAHSREISYLVITTITAQSHADIQLREGDRPATLAWPAPPSALFKAIDAALHGDAQVPEKAMVPQPDALAPSLLSARILLVEDHAINREVAAHLLSKTGCNLTAVSNGRDAVQAVEHTRFDAILMDLHMPEMDGLETTRRIRQMPNGIDIPIIAVTAAAMDDERSACLHAGMSDHIGKPLLPESLFAALRRWLPDLLGDPVDSSAKNNAPIASRDDGFAELGRRLGADDAIVNRLLLRFMEEFSEFDREIHLAIESSDLKQARALVHMLGGAAANLALRSLGEACGNLEATLVIDESQLVALQFENVSRALSAVISQIRTLPFDSLDVTNGGQKLTLITGLVTALETDTLEAIDFFAQARDCFEVQFGREIRPIANALASARISDALELAIQLKCQLEASIGLDQKMP